MNNYRHINDINNSNLKEFEAKRITEYLTKVNLPWLESEKNRIISCGKECEIIEGYTNNDLTGFALYYVNGHYKYDREKFENKFVLS